MDKGVPRLFTCGRDVFSFRAIYPKFKHTSPNMLETFSGLRGEQSKNRPRCLRSPSTPLSRIRFENKIKEVIYFLLGIDFLRTIKLKYNRCRRLCVLFGKCVAVPQQVM